MSVEALCSTHSVNLEWPTYGQDSSGGPTREPFVPCPWAQSVPCTIQPAAGNLVLAYAQRQIRLTSQAYFARNIGPVKAGYRLVTVDGQRTFVVHSYQDEAGMGVVWVADLEEVLK